MVFFKLEWHICNILEKCVVISSLINIQIEGRVEFGNNYLAIK